MTRVLAGKSQISPTGCLKRSKGRGLARVVGVLHQVGEHFKALTGGLGDQVLASLKVPVYSCRRYTRGLCGLGKGKACRTFFFDQRKSGLDQGLLEVAVVIPAFRHACVTSLFV